MTYEQLKKGDTIYYLNVTPEVAVSIINGNEKVKLAKVLDVYREGEFYAVETDMLGKMLMTLKEYFTNESDTAYSDNSAMLIATTEEGFMKELKKLLFENNC
jgi:hypothetical protein